MLLTKTDYLEYTFCRKNLWLRKHKPEMFLGIELSEFNKKIIEDGNLAESACRKLFPGGVLIESNGSAAVVETKAKINSGVRILFQGTFEDLILESAFYVRADILRFDDELGGWELSEVKATNEVKRKAPHHHINDLAYQKNVIEATGLLILKASVIHLNGEYRKHGNINYRELFIEEDVTSEVIEAQSSVALEMDQMKLYVNGAEEKGCDCVYDGKSNHCATFRYSNPLVPEYSVHHINRIGMSKKKLIDWVDQGIFSISDIPNPEDLNDTQRAQYDALILDRIIVNHTAISSMLAELKFPLQFFDFEGYSSAIPLFDGFGPYEQVPFQYSLHILNADGSLDHKEFLITEPKGDITKPLVERMRADLDENGTVVAWYKTYECQRIQKLIELHPEYSVFLQSIIDGMFDLMTVFSENHYVDHRFRGSASIKKVLPVLVPELSYASMNIHEGSQASERFEKMISLKTSPIEKTKIAQDLLDYCELDTLAMLEIYKRLIKIVS